LGKWIQKDMINNERVFKTLESECLLVVGAKFDVVLMIVLLIMTVLMLVSWYGKVLSPTALVSAGP
jgi:hypothetical protein